MRVVDDARDRSVPDPNSQDHAERLSGDLEAIASQLRLAVTRAVRRVCPRWLADEADDLTQIAMARMLARVRQTSGKIVITSGYVYRAVYSALVDEIRARRRRRETPIDEATGAVERRDSSAHSWEIREALAACLARLTVWRRRAVVLHLQGHSADEMAALLGCSLKRAQNLTYRGLANLRACLTARGVTP
jgi:RNA polymerase sigma-70 factor (ECF subfamily)